MRLAALLFFPLLMASLLLPQQSTPAPAAEEAEPVIRIDVDLVNLLFTARTRNGGLISTLTKDDITLYEDGKLQTLRSFTRESDLPLTIGLLVDVSGSQRNLIEEERMAASQFFQQVLRPKDMAFLISFGSEAELLQDSTNSAKLLRQGLEGLRVNAPVGGGIMNPGPVPTMSKMRGTVMHDAVYLAANEKLRSEAGRKVIVLITDGVDMGSRLKATEAIEAAQRADTIVYAIQYIDSGAYGWGGGDDGSLRKMAEETGGRVFRVNRKHTLSDIFKQIQEEVRSQYAVSFSSDNPARDNTFRKLQIKPKDKDTRIQARSGYYASASSPN